MRAPAIQVNFDFQVLSAFEDVFQVVDKSAPAAKVTWRSAASEPQTSHMQRDDREGSG